MLTVETHLTACSTSRMPGRHSTQLPRALETALATYSNTTNTLNLSMQGFKNKIVDTK